MARKHKKIQQKISIFYLFVAVIAIWFVAGVFIFRYAWKLSNSAVQGHYIEDGRIKLQIDPQKLKTTDPIEREKIKAEVRTYLEKLKDPSIDPLTESEKYT